MDLARQAQNSMDRKIVSCVEWALKHEAEVSTEMWEAALKVMRYSHDDRAVLKAVEILGDRLDPKPKSESAELPPVEVKVAILNADGGRATGHEVTGNGVRVRIGGAERNGT